MKKKNGKEVPNCVPKKESVKEDHSSDPNDRYVVRPCKNPNEPWAVWEGEVRVKGFTTKEDAQSFADMKNKEQGLTESDENPTDVVTMDIPLLIRMMEYAREDAKTDMDLHDITERMIELMQSKDTLSMEDYESIIGSTTPIDESIEFSKQQLDTLRKNYSTINKINPSSPAYTKLIKLLNSLDNKALKQIANADVKFVSMLAKNRIKEGEEIEEYDVETLEELNDFHQFMKEYKSDINEAEYQGRNVELGKPMQGDVKKFKVYVKNDKGNVVKVNFGQKGMVIKKDNPEARKSFRARMNCDSPGPRWKARYWSCRKW
jgi:hypothetical protein